MKPYVLRLFHDSFGTKRLGANSRARCRNTVAKDKGALMTLVYRKAFPRHRSRCLEDECAVAINPDTNKLLHHHKVTSAKKCDFPLVSWRTPATKQYKFKCSAFKYLYFPQAMQDWDSL